MDYFQLLLKREQQRRQQMEERRADYHRWQEKWEQRVVVALCLQGLAVLALLLIHWLA